MCTEDAIEKGDTGRYQGVMCRDCESGGQLQSIRTVVCDARHNDSAYGDKRHGYPFVALTL